MAKQCEASSFEIRSAANGYIVLPASPPHSFASMDQTFAFETFDSLVGFLKQNLPAPGEL